jgi:hypothetical protein
MKKYMLMLALVVIASPAWAVVTLSVVDNGDCTADIMYNVTVEPNKVAAFALDISVDVGTIVDVNDFHTGVSVAGDAGYGIFPANFDREITVNGDGTVNQDQWDNAAYNPVADGNDKGAAGALGTAAITVELGALYKGDNNAPASSGVLCSIEVSESCTVSLAGNAIRGAVVLEGAGEPSSVVYTPGPVACAGGELCLPASDPGYNDWVALGMPECWCYPRQCYGDADGLSEGGGKVPVYYVHFNDLNILLAAWDVSEPLDGPGILSTANGVCADFAHDVEGGGKVPLYRVHFNDLNLLIANWNVSEPLDGPGIAPDCGGTVVPTP